MYTFLSYTINSDTPFYGGRTGFNSKTSSSIENGDTANTSIWEFPNHLGTHIDFPYHFYQNGQTIEDFSEDFWIFNENTIQIIEVSLSKEDLLIKPKHLNNYDLNTDVEFLILKTGYGKYRDAEKYWQFNPGVDIETAEWIQKTFKKIRMIGLDSISISSWQHRDIGRAVHKKLLNPKKPILIIEDMDLSKVDSKTEFKKVYVAPLMINKSDGGPCTIIADVKNNE